MDLFLVHAPACVPDAGLLDIPPSPQVTRDNRVYEAESLLHCHDPEKCQNCARKKRRLSFHAYPTQQPTVPQTRRPSRPQLSTCRLLIAQLKHLVCGCASRRKYQVLTRYRYHRQKKPYSAISVHVENLTSETYDEDDLAGIPDLIEVVRLQATGPTEVARALRKKLKYGSVHRQLRALTILDGLLQNGGSRMQRTILSDGPLLERLRMAAVDSLSDPDIREKCKALFSQWVASSREHPGLEGAKSLYNQLPKKAQAPPQQRREQSRVLRENEEEARREDDFDDDDTTIRSRTNSVATNTAAEPSLLRKASIPSPASIPLTPSSTFGTRGKVKKEKKSKSKSSFNLSHEKPQILSSIASSSVASTNLLNALKLVNRENHRVSADPEVMSRFETCKGLRRQILRYIQHVETEELLGGLIHANEELVEALMAFEVLDKSVDDGDSDSEFEEAKHLSRQSARGEISAAKDKERMDGITKGVGNVGLEVQGPARPPRPRPTTQTPPTTKVSSAGLQKRGQEPDYDSLEDASSDEPAEEEDEENPFGDRNAVSTAAAAAGGKGRRGVKTAMAAAMAGGGRRTTREV